MKFSLRWVHCKLDHIKGYTHIEIALAWTLPSRVHITLFIIMYPEGLHMVLQKKDPWGFLSVHKMTTRELAPSPVWLTGLLGPRICACIIECSITDRSRPLTTQTVNVSVHTHNLLYSHTPAPLLSTLQKAFKGFHWTESLSLSGNFVLKPVLKARGLKGEWPLLVNCLWRTVWEQETHRIGERTCILYSGSKHWREDRRMVRYMGHIENNTEWEKSIVKKSYRENRNKGWQR